MKTIKINDRKFEIPTTFFDFNLEQYLQLLELEKKHKDKIIELIDFKLNYIAIATNIDLEFINKFSIKEFNNIFAEIYSVVSTKIPIMSDSHLKIGDKYYVSNFVKEMSSGQFFDLLLLCNDDYWKKADYIAASFYREAINTNSILFKGKKVLRKKIRNEDFISKEYDSKDCLEVCKKFRNYVPLPYIYTAVVFFLILMNEYKKNTPDYSKNQSLKTI